MGAGHALEFITVSPRPRRVRLCQEALDFSRPRSTRYRFDWCLLYLERLEGGGRSPLWKWTSKGFRQHRERARLHNREFVTSTKFQNPEDPRQLQDPIRYYQF